MNLRFISKSKLYLGRFAELINIIINVSLLPSSGFNLKFMTKTTCARMTVSHESGFPYKTYIILNIKKDNDDDAAMVVSCVHVSCVYSCGSCVDQRCRLR